MYRLRPAVQGARRLIRLNSVYNDLQKLKTQVHSIPHTILFFEQVCNFLFKLFFRNISLRTASESLEINQYISFLRNVHDTMRTHSKYWLLLADHFIAHTSEDFVTIDLISQTVYWLETKRTYSYVQEIKTRLYGWIRILQSSRTKTGLCTYLRDVLYAKARRTGDFFFLSFFKFFFSRPPENSISSASTRTCVGFHKIRAGSLCVYICMYTDNEYGRMVDEQWTGFKRVNFVGEEEREMT